jgi:hypothetical protein
MKKIITKKGLAKFVTKKRVLISFIPFFATVFIITFYFAFINSIERGSEIAIVDWIEVKLDISEKEELLINSQNDFEEFSDENIDFENYSVIVLSLGEKPTGGYLIDINKVVETSSSVRVYAVEYYPGKGCIVTTAFTYPTKSFVIEKTGKELEVFYERKALSC